MLMLKRTSLSLIIIFNIIILAFSESSDSHLKPLYPPFTENHIFCQIPLYTLQEWYNWLSIDQDYRNAYTSCSAVVGVLELFQMIGRNKTALDNFNATKLLSRENIIEKSSQSSGWRETSTKINKLLNRLLWFEAMANY